MNLVVDVHLHLGEFGEHVAVRAVLLDLEALDLEVRHVDDHYIAEQIYVLEVLF